MPKKKYKFKESDTKVYKTKDYKKFKYVKGNRSINDHHVFKLTKSIINKNLLKANPAIVNEKMEIIDGQHRFEYARNNDDYFYFTIAEGTGLADVQNLNAITKPWGTWDYINSYISLGNDDYKELKEFILKNDIPAYLSLELLSKSAKTRRTKASDLLKGGTFVVDDREFADTIVDILDDVREYVVDSAKKDRNLVRAVVKLHNSETADYNEFYDKLKTVNPLIEKQTSAKNYIREFEDILSFQSRKLRRIL